MKQNIIFPKYVLGKIRKVYFMALPETEEDLKKSRRNFALGEASAASLDQMTSNVYIVTLMVFLGISDANIGILMSLASLTATAQLLTIKLSKRMYKTKFFICLTNLFRFGLSGLYFIPLFDLPVDVRVLLFVLSFFFSKLLLQMSGPANQEWIASLVPQSSRGRYFSLKDITNCTVTAIILMFVGIVIDKYPGEAQPRAFVILGIVATCLVVIAFILFSLVSEPKLGVTNKDGKELHGRLATKNAHIENPKEKVDNKTSLLKEFKDCFKSSKFRKSFLLETLWMVTFYMSCPFNGSYIVKELKLSYIFISTVTFIMTILRIVVAPRFGRLGDRIGMAKTLKYAYLAFGINLLVYAFAVPSNGSIMYIVASIFATIAWGFIGTGVFNVKLELLGNENRMVKLAVSSSLIGIIGFVTSFLSGKLLDFLQNNPLELFGRLIYAQQILNVCAFFSTIILILYIKFVIQKEKPEISDTDGKIV